jgi:hypothetical protein
LMMRAITSAEKLHLFQWDIRENLYVFDKGSDCYMLIPKLAKFIQNYEFIKKTKASY